MKIFALATIALTAFAPAAFAMTGGLTASEEFEIRAQVPTADLSNLTDAQALALSAAIHHGSGSESGRMIRSILN